MYTNSSSSRFKKEDKVDNYAPKEENAFSSPRSRGTNSPFEELVSNIPSARFGSKMS